MTEKPCKDCGEPVDIVNYMLADLCRKCANKREGKVEMIDDFEVTSIAFAEGNMQVEGKIIDSHYVDAPPKKDVKCDVCGKSADWDEESKQWSCTPCGWWICD